MKAHKIGGIFYILWGAVHVWVGATIIAKAAGPQATDALAFQVDARPDTVPAALTAAMEAVLRQHGWNLLWLGAVIAALGVALFLKARPSDAAFALLIGGLADLGYLWALVLPGFVKTETWIGGPLLFLLGAAFTAPLLFSNPSAQRIPNSGGLDNGRRS